MVLNNNNNNNNDDADDDVLLVNKTSYDPTYLNDMWTLYFHEADSSDWTLSSYVRLTDVSTVEEFWNMSSLIHQLVSDNMFFLMREGVYPCWDDVNNMQGGSISLKVPKTEAVRAWESICKRVLGECMVNVEEVDSSNSSSINGVSISPKRYFCIIKIWLKDNKLQRSEQFSLPSWYKGDLLYKSHIECIQANTDRLTINSTNTTTTTTTTH
jgi:hypothetical protein